MWPRRKRNLPTVAGEPSVIGQRTALGSQGSRVSPSFASRGSHVCPSQPLERVRERREQPPLELPPENRLLVLTNPAEMSFARDEGRTLPPSVDAFINMRDLVVGDNDWYNVTPSVRRAIEGFALILRDHEARLMNGGDSGSSTLEVAQLKDRITRLEEELAVAKRRVAEVTDVAVRAASDAKTAVVDVDAIKPDVDRLAAGLSPLLEDEDNDFAGGAA